LGWWGKNLVGEVQGRSDKLRFVRGVTKEPEAVREFAAKHGFALSTDLAEALADPQVRAVVLATPHSLHPEQICAAAAAGKAVFCEKPLALSYAGAKRAVDACARAGVPLGLGTNKRFWPNMRELERIVASGELGEPLHVEGHSSNENSGALYAAWRDIPGESPGGGMTGAGLHVLDALVGLAGPVRRVHGQLIRRKPGPDPLDTATVLLEFASRTSGTLATVRSSPTYWRIHVFGRKGSAEALGDTELVLRMSGAPVRRVMFPPVAALRAELEAFADAVEGRAPYPIPTDQMLATVAAFEATIRALESGSTVEVA